MVAAIGVTIKNQRLNVLLNKKLIIHKTANTIKKNTTNFMAKYLVYKMINSPTSLFYFFGINKTVFCLWDLQLYYVLFIKS